MEQAKRKRDGGQGLIQNEMSPDALEIQKLKNSLKKIEEQKELLAIEKEQLEVELKEKVSEIEIMKAKSKNISIGEQEIMGQFQEALGLHRNFSLRLKKLQSVLPFGEDYSTLVNRIEEYSIELNKVNPIITDKDSVNNQKA